MKLKLIVGLGNPGEKFQGTRHNIGFQLVKTLARDRSADFQLDQKIESELALIDVDGKKLFLAKPQTFVNKSGGAVKKLKNKFKLKAENILIVHDDLDITLGSFKFSFARDSAGHRGVASVIKALKTKDFWRLRLGTANKNLALARRKKNLEAKKKKIVEFVLSKFTPTEETKIKKVIKGAINSLMEKLG